MLTNSKRWLNLWSTARYDLQLTDEEFWHMTGRQLSALTRRHKQASEREHYLVGLLASVTANFSMCRPKEPLTPSDFMPNRKEKERTDLEVAQDFADKFKFIAISTAGINSVPTIRSV